MGLDIYLYRYDNFEETQRKEKEANDFSEKKWEGKEWDKMTEPERDELYAKDHAFNESLGLDKYGADETGKEKIEINSEKYPDHYFKIGYFRSSYNGGGINHILENLGLPRLNEMFEVASDEYEVQPDWAEAKKNLQEVYNRFKTMGAYRVAKVSGNFFDPDRGPKSEKEALDIFLAELAKHNEVKEKDPDFLSYENRDGIFYLGEPAKVKAFISGKEKFLGQRDCTYFVTESDNTWYLQAIEIMIDTCDYVLAQDNINQYYLHWIG